MSQKLSLLNIVSTFEEKIQNKMFCYTLSLLKNRIKEKLKNINPNLLKGTIE